MKQDQTKTDGAAAVSSTPFVRCEVLFPHVREIGGQTWMLEPMLSGIVALPNDEDTQKCIERGWLKVVPPNDPAQAGRASDVRLLTDARSRPCLQPDGWAGQRLLSAWDRNNE
jgi:hypothetical protein